MKLLFQHIEKNNLNNLVNHDNFTFIEENILSLNLKKLLSDIDFVFHQTVQEGIRVIWGVIFQKYTNNNILVTRKLMETAKN